MLAGDHPQNTQPWLRGASWSSSDLPWLPLSPGDGGVSHCGRDKWTHHEHPSPRGLPKGVPALPGQSPSALWRALSPSGPKWAGLQVWQRGRGCPCWLGGYTVWGEQRAGAPAADSGCIMGNCVSRERAGKPRACGAVGEGSGVGVGPGARALEGEGRALRSIAEGQPLDPP